jgi:hypothetical protein
LDWHFGGILLLESVVEIRRSALHIAIHISPLSFLFLE